MPARLTPVSAPSPTPPPLPPNSPLKRDVANEGLCGFKVSVSGFNTNTDPWVCSASSTCMWNTDIGAVGCCRTGKCNFHTSCVEFEALGGCGSACSADTLNLLCTDPVLQYCATATFEGNYFAYLCEPSTSWWWTVALTSQGQTAALSGIPRFTGSNAVVVTSSSPSLTSNSPFPHPKSNNVGAIAGGAVGGLAVLCLFALALAFLILRYRQPLRVVQPADADGRLSTLIPVPAPAELSPSSMRAELSGDKVVGGHEVELDGKPQE